MIRTRYSFNVTESIYFCSYNNWIRINYYYNDSAHQNAERRTQNAEFVPIHFPWTNRDSNFCETSKHPICILDRRTAQKNISQRANHVRCIRGPAVCRYLNSTSRRHGPLIIYCTWTNKYNFHCFMHLGRRKTNRYSMYNFYCLLAKL